MSYYDNARMRRVQALGFVGIYTDSRGVPQRYVAFVHSGCIGML